MPIRAGLVDFCGLQAMAVRAMVESSESFARLRVPSNIDTMPLHIQLLDREQVPMDLHREIGGGARIRAGIEFDTAGRRVTYRVLSSRPDDPLGSLRMDPIRVPAADCPHLFKPLAAGQLRGITRLAPVLLRLHELGQFEDAALVKARVAALFTGLITDPDGTARWVQRHQHRWRADCRNGTWQPDSAATRHRHPFFLPTESEAYAPFVKNHLRAVAAGMGLPHELVSGDLEGVTHSSIRAGPVEFHRRVEQPQHNVVVHMFCRPVWERFVRLAVLTGDLPARDFDRNAATVKTKSPSTPCGRGAGMRSGSNAAIVTFSTGFPS